MSSHLKVAGLGVVRGLDEPSILILQDVVLAGPEVCRNRVRATLTQVIRAYVGGWSSLDRAVWLDDRVITEGISADSAAVLEDLLGLVEGLQVRAHCQRRVVKPVDLVEVIEPGVALLLVGDLGEDDLQGRHEAEGRRHVGVGLGVDELLAELGRAASGGGVERRHAVITLVVRVWLLLEHAVEPASALAPAADGHELGVRGHLLPRLQVCCLVLCHDDRHRQRRVAPDQRAEQEDYKGKARSSQA
mmetsp:Transcript_111526/g.270946  ORF Transcript_111526/g.270946 Transcript_111526/m.270946 type:complete len:246 (+) Transcript_111526:108-845(+)